MTAQKTIARLRLEVAEMNERIADLEYDCKILEIDAKKYHDLCEILRNTPGLTIQTPKKVRS